MKFEKRVRVHVLYDSQISRLRAQSDEGIGALSTRPTQAHLKDLDQLAGEVRDPGQLPEPLADSVLEYSTHRCQPIGNVHSRAIQELEDATSPDQPTQTTDEGPHSSQLSASAALYRGGEPTTLLAQSQENHPSLFATPGSSGPGYWSSASQMVVSQLAPWDLLEMNSDTLQQPNLGYDDLLGLDGTMW